MADDLATDAAYIEACRVAAWSERPLSETDSYWNAGAGKFDWPDGWPGGVEPEQFVRAQLAAAAPPVAPLPDRVPSGPVSPSVRRLREMLR